VSDHDQAAARTRRAARRILLALFLSVLGSATFAWGYAADGGTQVLGAGLGVAFAGIAYALATWAMYLMPTGGYVEEHPGFSSSPREQDLLADAVTAPPGPVSRPFLLGLAGLAAGALGLATLFPFRSLMSPRFARPVRALRRTAWASGRLRLVDPEGRPVRAADVTAATISSVYPEGHVGEADSLAFVVRIDPARLARRPPPGGDVDGVVAYSQMCTHAGCTVAVYEQGTGQVVCPCHQSAFDLWSAARPTSGPAGRPLPGLPIDVDSEGFLVAKGDFTAPPGPGFWSLK
jgi:ubiquinol-cytochrome c reductase iron-sulfur subunit